MAAFKGGADLVRALADESDVEDGGLLHGASGCGPLLYRHR
jgi:hypothetical protein